MSTPASEAARHVSVFSCVSSSCLLVPEAPVNLGGRKTVHEMICRGPFSRGDFPMSRSRSTTVCAFLTILVCARAAADRQEVTFADPRIFPESLTSTKDGTLFFGSLGQDSVYRAASSAPKAEVWIKPKSNGLSTVLGVFADEKAGTLWVCSSATGGRNGAPVVGETALKAFNLKSAAFKASYPFPNNGLCN